MSGCQALAHRTRFDKTDVTSTEDPEKLARLEKLYGQLDPFVLKKTIGTKLRAVLRHQVWPIRSQSDIRRATMIQYATSLNEKLFSLGVFFD
jgi:hypothetical protein